VKSLTNQAQCHLSDTDSTPNINIICQTLTAHQILISSVRHWQHTRY